MERKKIILSLLLISLPLSSTFAKVYQSVNERGNASFSDQPSRHSKQVELPPVQTYSSPKLDEQTARTQADESTQHEPLSYTSLLLSGVKSNTTLTYNQPINVMVTSIPPLQKDDRYLLLVDGQSLGESQTSGQFIIPADLQRGLHTIKAVIINADHNIVKESNVIQFTIFQRSKLSGPNKGS